MGQAILPQRRKRLRLGVVGCGRVFERHHLLALRGSSDWVLAAIGEPDGQRREWVQSIRPRPLSIFDSAAALLNRSGLDALLITTPPATHAQLAIQALEAGLHVLVEKPMALNLAEAQRMLEASRRAQRLLWVGFNRRFLPPYLLLKKELRTVARSALRGVRFTFSTNAAGWRSVTGYFGNDAEGGGVLDDLVSHQLDLLPWLLDLKMHEVRAMRVAADQSEAQHVNCEVRFNDGLVARCEAIHGRPYSEDVEVLLEDRTYVARWRRGLEISRTRTGRPRLLEQVHDLGRSLARRWGSTRNPMAESFARQLTAFAAAVREPQNPYSGADARSGARTVGAIEACRESLRHGGTWIALRQGGDAP
jgi:predicted dehydrogenase